MTECGWMPMMGPGLLLMVLFWVFVIVGVVYLVRWLMGQGIASRPESSSISSKNGMPVVRSASKSLRKCDRTCRSRDIFSGAAQTELFFQQGGHTSCGARSAV